MKRLLALGAAGVLLAACGADEQVMQAVVQPDAPPVTAGPFNPSGDTLPPNPSDTRLASVVSVDIPPVPTDDIVGISSQLPPPPETAPPCNEAGLWCLPFAPPGLDNCAEMDWYAAEFSLPTTVNVRFGTGGFDSQPRRPASSFGEQGIGWRESNCRNDARPTTRAARCCRGWWGIATSNINAPGYAYGFMVCGIKRGADYYGRSPLQKQKSACAASVLYSYWLDHPGSKWPWAL